SRAALALALGLGFAAGPAWCAWPHDPLANVQVAPANGVLYLTGIPDGSGGALMVWGDLRNGGPTNIDIYAQRVTAQGTIAGGCPSSGLAICTASGSQIRPVIVSDGAGGALIAWTDPRNASLDIYAMRVSGSGTFPGGWPANGVQLLADTHNEDYAVIATD